MFTYDNVLSWVFQREHFFHFHQITGDQRLHITTFYMSGQALQGYHWMHTTTQLTSREVFVQQVELYFGPSSFVNHEAQMFKLKQRSTVTAYAGEFETLSTRISGLNPVKLLNCFLSSLRDDIQ